MTSPRFDERAAGGVCTGVWYKTGGGRGTTGAAFVWSDLKDGVVGRGAARGMTSVGGGSF